MAAHLLWQLNLQSDETEQTRESDGSKETDRPEGPENREMSSRSNCNDKIFIHNTGTIQRTSCRFQILDHWSRVVTLALHPLAEESLQQPLAELADGGTSVRVHGEGVRDLHPAQDHLLHPDGAAAEQGVTLRRAQ